MLTTLRAKWAAKKAYKKKDFSKLKKLFEKYKSNGKKQYLLRRGVTKYATRRLIRGEDKERVKKLDDYMMREDDFKHDTKTRKIGRTLGRFLTWYNIGGWIPKFKFHTKNYSAENIEKSVNFYGLKNKWKKHTGFGAVAGGGLGFLLGGPLGAITGTLLGAGTSSTLTKYEV